MQRAREILKVMEDNFPLGPNQQKIIEVEVEQGGDFSDFPGGYFCQIGSARHSRPFCSIVSTFFPVDAGRAAMRTLFAGTLLALLLVLFSGTAYMGGRPVISTVVHPFEQAVSFTQAFDLWVDEPGQWQLSLICPPHGLTLNQSLWQGHGGGYERRAVDIGVDSAALGEGLHRLKLEIIMEGAQAILGLPCAGEYWILPLNGPMFA